MVENSDAESRVKRSKKDDYFSKSEETDGYKLQSLAIGVCDALYAAIRHGV